MGYKRIVIAGSRSAVGKTSNATILGKRGDTVRGHEFHYSSLTGTDDDFPYAYTWQVGEKFYHDGYTAPGILASYLHLHFLGNQQAAANFLTACRRFLKAYRRRNASCIY